MRYLFLGGVKTLLMEEYPYSEKLQRFKKEPRNRKSPKPFKLQIIFGFIPAFFRKFNPRFDEKLLMFSQSVSGNFSIKSIL